MLVAALAALRRRVLSLPRSPAVRLSQDRIGRRAASGEPDRRRVAGVLRRRDDGGADQRPVEDLGAARSVADLDHALPQDDEVSAGDREGARCRRHRRGLGVLERLPGQDHRAVDRRVQGQAPLGGILPARPEGRPGAPGRGGPGDRRRRCEPAHPEERTHLAAVAPVDPEAYEAYLQGRYYWYRRTPADGSRVATSSRRPSTRTRITRPAGRAWRRPTTCWSRVRTAQWRLATAARRALEACAKAISLDPTNAEAYALRGMVRFYFDRDAAAAESDFRRPGSSIRDTRRDVSSTPSCS